MLFKAEPSFRIQKPLLYALLDTAPKNEECKRSFNRPTIQKKTV